MGLNKVQSGQYLARSGLGHDTSIGHDCNIFFFDNLIALKIKKNTHKFEFFQFKK